MAIKEEKVQGIKELRKAIKTLSETEFEIKIMRKPFLKILKYLDKIQNLRIFCNVCNKKYTLFQLKHQANALLCPNCLE